MLEVATEIRTDTARVALVGELDLATAQRLEDALVGVEAIGPECIVLDLHELSFVDVRGLHAIIDAAKRVEQSGASLVLVGAQPPVARLLSISGADEDLRLSDEDDELSVA